MSADQDPGSKLVSEETRSFEQHDEHTTAHADRPPTPDEAAAAEQVDPDPAVAEAYEAAAQRGVEQEGEGKIPG